MGECPLSPYLHDVLKPLSLFLQNWSLKLFPCFYPLLHPRFSSCHLPLPPSQKMQGTQYNQGQVSFKAHAQKEVCCSLRQLEVTHTSTFPYFIIEVLSLGISPCIIRGTW